MVIVMVTAMTASKIRTYSELIKIPTFEERFEYLKLNGEVASQTFGFERYLNQKFYRSAEWKKIRDIVILRDNGCDLSMDGFEIYGRVIIHHMNPITKYDIEKRTALLLDPEHLISTVKRTHDAIHYSDINILSQSPVERSPNDMCPWKLR